MIAALEENKLMKYPSQETLKLEGRISQMEQIDGFKEGSNPFLLAM